MGVLYDFLDPIGHRGPLLHEDRPITVQVAQLPNWFGRNETTAQQSVLQQLGDPFAILDVRLAARNGFDMLAFTSIGSKRLSNKFQTGADAAAFLRNR